MPSERKLKFSVIIFADARFATCRLSTTFACQLNFSGLVILQVEPCRTEVEKVVICNSNVDFFEVQHVIVIVVVDSM